MEKSISTIVANMMNGSILNISTKKTKKSKSNQPANSNIDRSYDRSESVKRGDDFHFFI